MSYCLSQCTAQQVLETNLIPSLWHLHENERYITGVHAAFLEAAIIAQQYENVEQHILYSWPTPDHNTVAAKDVLRYYYLRGMIHMGSERWHYALRCFYVCLCYPSKSVVSALTVAAYKKYILLLCFYRGDCASFTVKDLELPDNACSPLVRLIGDATGNTRSSLSYHQPGQQKRGAGYTTPPSKSASAAASAGSAADLVMEMMVHRDATEVSAFAGGGCGGGGGGAPGRLNDNAPPTLMESLNMYKIVATAFANVDRLAFSELVQSPLGIAVFAEDGNAGLVDRVAATLLRRHLYVIGGVYATLSVTQLANECNMPVENVPIFLQMIRDDKKWPVAIDADGFVVFPRHPPRLNGAAVLNDTHTEVAIMRQLMLKANEAKLQQQGSNKGGKMAHHHFNNNNNSKGPARSRSGGEGGSARFHQQQPPQQQQQSGGDIEL